MPLIISKPTEKIMPEFDDWKYPICGYPLDGDACPCFDGDAS